MAVRRGGPCRRRTRSHHILPWSRSSPAPRGGLRGQTVLAPPEGQWTVHSRTGATDTSAPPSLVSVSQRPELPEIGSSSRRALRTANSRARPTSTGTMARLYAAGARTSSMGRAASAATRPASAKRAAVGACPRSIPSAAWTRMQVGATAVRARRTTLSTLSASRVTNAVARPRRSPSRGGIRDGNTRFPRHRRGSGGTSTAANSSPDASVVVPGPVRNSTREIVLVPCSDAISTGRIETEQRTTGLHCRRAVAKISADCSDVAGSRRTDESSRVGKGRIVRSQHLRCFNIRVRDECSQPQAPFRSTTMPRISVMR